MGSSMILISGTESTAEPGAETDENPMTQKLPRTYENTDHTTINIQKGKIV